MAIILDGKKTAEKRLEILREEIDGLRPLPTTRDSDRGERSGIPDVYQDEAPCLRAGRYRLGWEENWREMQPQNRC